FPGCADELFTSRDTGAPKGDEIVALGGKQLRAVQGKQRIAFLHPLPGLVHEQLFNVRVVLEYDVADLRLVDLDAAAGAKGDAQRPPLDLGIHDADELLSLRRELDGLRAAFARWHRRARLHRVALVRWRYLEAHLGVRMARSIDADGQRPVAQHREWIHDLVPAPSIRLDVAAAFHLGHRAHRRHVVDEPQLRTVDRIPL